MAEAKKNEEKVIFSELSRESRAKTLQAMFMKYGQIVEVIMRKDRETNKARRGARKASDGGGPAGVKGAAGKATGKPADGKARAEKGKACRAEVVTNPAFRGGGLGPAPPPRCTRPPRGGRGGRGRSGGCKRHPA